MRVYNPNIERELITQSNRLHERFPYLRVGNTQISNVMAYARRVNICIAALELRHDEVNHFNVSTFSENLKTLSEHYQHEFFLDTRYSHWLERVFPTGYRTVTRPALIFTASRAMLGEKLQMTEESDGFVVECLGLLQKMQDSLSQARFADNDFPEIGLDVFRRQVDKILRNTEQQQALRNVCSAAFRGVFSANYTDYRLASECLNEVVDCVANYIRVCEYTDPLRSITAPRRSPSPDQSDMMMLRASHRSLG